MLADSVPPPTGSALPSESCVRALLSRTVELDRKVSEAGYLAERPDVDSSEGFNGDADGRVVEGGLR